MRMQTMVTGTPHQALGYATPVEWYHSPESFGAKPASWSGKWSPPAQPDRPGCPHRPG